MASQSSGSSEGSSSSNPVLPEWSQQLSSIIAALAASMNSWADQQYAQGQAVTGQTIQGFLEQSGQAAGFANNLLRQYTDIFEPLINNFAAKAESWASEARRVFNMGQAESTAAQADQAGMESLKRQLEREGVNTSSGAMTEIMRKSAMDDARNRTMAGTQAGMQTEQMGMQMEQIAGQMGQNVPGMWATAASVRTAALNAMEQAILGLLNTGVNLKHLPVDAYQAAANAIKLGQQARSQQQSRQGSTTTDPSHSGSDRNQDPNKNRQPNQNADPNSRNHSGSDPRFDKGPTNGANGRTDRFQPGSLIKEVPEQPQYAGDWWKDPNLGMPPPSTTDWSGNNVPTIDPVTGQQVGQQLPDPLPNTNGGQISPFGPNSPMVQQPTDMPGKDYDWSQVPTSGNFGQIPNQSGPGANYPNTGQVGGDQQQWPDTGMMGGETQTGQGNGGFNDTGWGQSPTDLVQPWNGDWGQTPEPTINPNSTDFGDGSWGQQPDTSWQGDTWTQPDQTSQDAWQQASNDGQDGGAMDMWGDQPPPEPSFDENNFDAGYAKGGVIPTTGGHVPRSASPSRGKQTDDIPARLNADEYVIPKDVVRHFGTRHFDGLVAKSRKARTGMAGAKPQAERKPALPTMGRPTFVSRYMGGR